MTQNTCFGCITPLRLPSVGKNENLLFLWLSSPHITVSNHHSLVRKEAENVCYSTPLLQVSTSIVKLKKNQRSTSHLQFFMKP